jgi:GR25 family glycosyltransferase involved in LPS biosynthesis
VEACTPKTMPKFISPLMCSTVMDTEYACIASHLKAIHTAYMNNEKYAIIAEDDAMIIKDIDWNLLLKSAPNNWNLLQMHTCCIPFLHFDKKSNSYQNSSDILWVKTNNIIPSAAFYIINRVGMFILLNRFIPNFNKNWDQITHIDLSLAEVNCQADLILFHNIERYICMQTYITIDDSPSTIHWSHNFNYNIQGL